MAGTFWRMDLTGALVVLELELERGLAAVVVGVEVSKLLLFYPDNRILDD